MSDREQIVEKLNLYALAVDAQCWDLFDRIFTEYCDVDYGTTARWTTREQFKSDFGAYHAPFDATQHVMMNHQVNLQGDRANSLTYGNWRLVRYAAEGDPLWDGTGWYDDDWVRTHAGWQIARRVCRVIWFTGNDKVKETIPGVTFPDERTSLREEWRAGQLAFLQSIS